MSEIDELKNELAILKLVAGCSTKFDEYLEIIEKTGITLATPQRLELFIFCSFVPYLTIMLRDGSEETRNSCVVSFMSALLEYKPKQLTDREFELLIEAQESDEDDSTVLDYIHTYFESWIQSLQISTIEEDKKITYAISGIHIKLSSRLAYLSDEYQSLEDKRFETMGAGKAVEMMGIMLQQSELEDSVTLKYMSQIQTLMSLTFGHLGETSAILKEMI